MNRQRTALAVPFLILLMASPAIAAATPASPVNLDLQGIITDAGSQSYQVSGGQLVTADVQGVQLGAQHSSLEYSLQAQVTGLATTGDFSLLMTSSSTQGEVQVSGSVVISDSVAAAEFPFQFVSGQPVSCTSSCTSEIPLLFTGLGTFTISEGGVTTVVTLPFAVESPYWNPFGGPILMTSLDDPENPSIVIIAGYHTGTVQWTGVQLNGGMAGSFKNGTEVSGEFGLLTSSSEDLFAGVEHDQGLIAFSGTTPASLSMSGSYSGTTTIPRQGTMSCALELGLPAGTCTSTSASSVGVFEMSSATASLHGVYKTQWSQPSLTTLTRVVAVMHVSVS